MWFFPLCLPTKTLYAPKYFTVKFEGSMVCTICTQPKIRILLTHSRQMSLQEAITRGVPLGGIPVFAEAKHGAGYVSRLRNSNRFQRHNRVANLGYSRRH